MVIFPKVLLWTSYVMVGAGLVRACQSHGRCLLYSSQPKFSEHVASFCYRHYSETGRAKTPPQKSRSVLLSAWSSREHHEFLLGILSSVRRMMTDS